MNDEINYKTNPLHGVSLKNLLIEMVNHYGFDILFAYLNINCFKTNPSIDSSVKFLKKTDWAREKVEAFYLYEFKNLPRASDEQFQLPPRNRIVPENQTPGDPAELSLEDAERLREKRAKKSAEYGSVSGKNYGAQLNARNSNDRGNDGARKDDRESPNSSSTSVDSNLDPWAKWKK
ncbi:MAG: VF530 family DNA-binding protein [Arenicellales bacterium]